MIDDTNFYLEILLKKQCQKITGAGNHGKKGQWLIRKGFSHTISSGKATR